MRAVYVVWLAAVAFGGTICRAETQFPYELTIDRDAITVRSGPSQDFYPTSQLTSGAKIEVYRHEPGGWLAIRPPTDSFSLVKRSQLRPSPGGNVAKVLRDRTVCRVGSHVADPSQYATHVLLHAGELVELLPVVDDTQPASIDDARDDWVRIWPPAGEFRWVRADDVAKQGSAATRNGEIPNDAEDAEDADGELAEPTREVPRPLLGPGSEESLSPAEAASETVRVPTETAVSVPRDASVDSVQTEKQDRVEPPPVQPEVSTEASRWRERTDAESLGGEAVRVPVGNPSTPAIPTSPREGREETQADEPDEAKPAAAPVWVSRNRLLRDDLDSLELELAMMVSQEMRAWRLDALSKRVEQAATRISDPTQQTRAQGLLQRIDEFAQLLDRAAGVSPIDSASHSQPVRPLTEAAPDGGQADSPVVRYDGSGWLVPVHATKGTVPPYALLDAQGDVMHYVSPSPGLNLQRYVRKRIGVFGQQGFVRSLNKPHVTAERVVDLDRHLR